ncbi:unnamed protein product [Clonostachys rosea]|uniref:Pectate lyase superfamily protein domain-containing protein n=1 Tax=Bionectria ochroleuca TaxID=29856 RepID=A0ABY6U4Z8_BIOOC|nr:unnamed protein product [Clonostachys rosea]
MVNFLNALVATAACVGTVSAQLSGPVGPVTSSSSEEASKICNILDFGGIVSTETDNHDAILRAWGACAAGGQVYIPEGDYGLASWLLLKHGNGTSINLEGTIYRTGSGGGNMILIRDSTDIEIYSANSKGAIQGYGYEFHKQGGYGPRIMRLYHVSNFSIHDITLVDSPAFHLSLDSCENGEIYNIVIRGGNKGGLDGLDVWSSNIWIHDVEVTNKDECVTVKTPSDHILVERIHCNWSGGSAMGSLGTNVSVHDIEYRDSYTHHAHQMYLIKSNGGCGNVYNIAFHNFIGHSNAYSFDLDSAWTQLALQDGDGISFSNITISSWSGMASNAAQRGPIKIHYPAGVPCTGITVRDFDIGTETGNAILYSSQNAYGSGACLQEGTAYVQFSSTQTISTLPSTNYATKMAGELSTGLGLTASIAIPTIPASFFPGKLPISAILGSFRDAKTSRAGTSSETIPVLTPSSTLILTVSRDASATSSTSGTEADQDRVTQTSSFSHIGNSTTSTVVVIMTPLPTGSSSKDVASENLSSRSLRPSCGGRHSHHHRH